MMLFTAATPKEPIPTPDFNSPYFDKFQPSGGDVGLLVYERFKLAFSLSDLCNSYAANYEEARLLSYQAGSVLSVSNDYKLSPDLYLTAEAYQSFMLWVLESSHLYGGGSQ